MDTYSNTDGIEEEDNSNICCTEHSDCCNSSNDIDDACNKNNADSYDHHSNMDHHRNLCAHDRLKLLVYWKILSELIRAHSSLA